MIRIHDPSLSDGLRPQRMPDARNPIHGVVVGIVTNIVDPKSWGRIKVRYPWCHDDVESNWARIAQPYAGKGRGTFWLPEVGDEVCVAFDGGDLNVSPPRTPAGERVTESGSGRPPDVSLRRRQLVAGPRPSGGA